jgi:hypothetical protein
MMFTTNGKEVLRLGAHFADTDSPDAALAIVAAFDNRESIAAYLVSESRNKGRSRYFRRMLSILADNVRSRMDVVEVAPEGERARYHEEKV